MTTVKDIAKYIDAIAPYDTQCSFDNCGLLIGESNNKIDTVAVSLDLTDEVLEETISAGAQLLITHHPVIFHAKKKLIDNDCVLKAIRSGISVISAHTCFDCADGGVNDVLVEILRLKDVEKVPSDECIVPMARIGYLENEMDSRSFAKYVGQKLDTTVQLINSNNKINKVAVCGGAGMSFMGEILKMGADAYVTGEAKYNEMLEAKAEGLSVVVAGHFETEYPSMAYLSEKIQKEFPELKVVNINQSRAVEYI